MKRKLIDNRRKNLSKWNKKSEKRRRGREALCNFIKRMEGFIEGCFKASEGLKKLSFILNKLRSKQWLLMKRK